MTSYTVNKNGSKYDIDDTEFASYGDIPLHSQPSNMGVSIYLIYGCNVASRIVCRPLQETVLKTGYINPCRRNSQCLIVWRLVLLLIWRE